MTKMQEKISMYLTIVTAIIAIGALTLMTVNVKFMSGISEDVSGEAYALVRNPQTNLCREGYTYSCSCIAEQPTAQNQHTTSGTTGNDNDEDEHWGSS
jgi:hypothetical protein